MPRMCRGRRRTVADIDLHGSAASPGSAGGRLSARERLDRLLDAGSFAESGALVSHRCSDFGLAGRTVPGDGVITGWGTIDGRVVYVLSQDCTVFGGSLGEAGGGKVCNVLDLAAQNGAPVIALYDGGGARIQEGVAALGGFAEVFRHHALNSGVVPQITAVMGSCAGGAAYSPAVTDFIFMVEGSYMSLTGPEVIRAVMHQEVTNEELGGVSVHSTKTGLAHFAHPDDAACLHGIRELLSFLPSNYLDPPPLGTSADSPDRRTEELEQLVSPDGGESYDMKRLIRAVVDDGRFLEVQQRYARNLIVGFARLDNRAVGVVANQPSYLAGALTIDAAVKGSRFVRFCDAFQIPVVTLVDCPGFMPSVQEEVGGVIRHGAKLPYAYAEATVPMITLITRKAYGGAYGALGSKHLRNDTNLAFPGAEIAVVGAEAAVGLLYRREIRQAGEHAEELRAQRLQEYRQQFATPYRAAELGYVDAIIRPSDTRAAIIRALRCLIHKRTDQPHRRHSTMPL
jgi:propionyl-CoA carboxylase beta chain